MKNNLYILLDAARMQGHIGIAKKLCPIYCCIYNSKEEPIFQKLGPYIFKLDGAGPFWEWYQRFGWGQSWGYLFQTKTSLSHLQEHFSRHKFALDEKGAKKYFRYYDPRVFKRLLPLWNIGQVKDLFGPIENFIVEGESRAEAFEFWLENGKLKSRKLDVQELFDKTVLSSNNQ